jgi:hypothetical protein
VFGDDAASSRSRDPRPVPANCRVSGSFAAMDLSGDVPQ